MAEFISSSQISEIIRNIFPEGAGLDGNPQGRIGTLLASIINTALTRMMLDVDGRIAAIQSSGTLDERVLALEQEVARIRSYVGGLSSLIEIQRPPVGAPPAPPPPIVDNLGAGDVGQNTTVE